MRKKELIKQIEHLKDCNNILINRITPMEGKIEQYKEMMKKIQGTSWKTAILNSDKVKLEELPDCLLCNGHGTANVGTKAVEAKYKEFFVQAAEAAKDHSPGAYVDSVAEAVKNHQGKYIMAFTEMLCPRCCGLGKEI
jgi:hypothetical protein